MTRLIHRRFPFSNIVALVALFVALGTGSAYAAYVISSNSQIGPATIAGHHTPTGDQANIISGTINGADIQAGSIGSGQLTASEGWHAITANERLSDPCPWTTGVFCGDGSSNGYWENSGGSFAPAAFYRDPQQRVHLRGLVSWESSPGSPTSDSEPIFLLPPAYRPAHELVFTTLDNDSGGSYLVRVDVKPDGEVMVINDDMVKDNPQTCETCAFTAGGAFLSLDGISFRFGE